MSIALQPVVDRPEVVLRYEVAGRLDAESSAEVREVERAAGPDTVVEIDLRNCEGMDTPAPKLGRMRRSVKRERASSGVQPRSDMR